jgi:Na+-translocating ferredoxin:NAD+ oxidoreductase subunit B
MIEQLNDLLPQTQCGQCSFKGCRPYAEAILSGEADINQCPPSGNEGIARIAAFLNLPAKPLNTQFGEHKPKSVAVIDEASCIGCVKCIAVCPVDAILGSSKMMHTVILSECTGCELCIPACPVDCISMQVLENSQLAPTSSHAKMRYENHQARKEKEAFEKAEKLRLQKARLLTKK